MAFKKYRIIPSYNGIFPPMNFKSCPPQLPASFLLLVLTQTFWSVYYAVDTAWGWRIKDK